MIIKTFDAFSRLSIIEINKVTNFISDSYTRFRETKTAIRKSILYATKEISGLGGFVFLVEHNNAIVAAAVVNKTGMHEYLAENILVYLAVKEEYRRQGIGDMLVKHILLYCKGDISIHIHKDSNVIELFEKHGFKPRNIEMRLTR